MLENTNHWTPPDGLGYSALRPVRLTGQGIALVVVTVVMVIGALTLGVVLTGVARRQAREQGLLESEGRTIDAAITRTWIDSSKERQRRISYRFEYGGNIYTRHVEAPRKIWETLAPGSTLLVRFAPSQPTVNHPVAWDGRDMPPWLPWVIAGTLGGLGLLPLIPIRIQSRLLAEGRPAPGSVTKVRRGKGIFVSYDFRLLNGSIAKGRSPVNKAPLVGASICVLYDPENPRRNAIYPLTMVRLDSGKKN